MNRTTMMIIAAALAFAANAFGALAVGDEGPEITFNKSWNAGDNTKLSDYRGNYVMVNLWGTG